MAIFAIYNYQFAKIIRRVREGRLFGNDAADWFQVVENHFGGSAVVSLCPPFIMRLDFCLFLHRVGIVEIWRKSCI